MAAKRKKTPKQVETLKHDEAKRTNIPTAEYQSLLDKEAQDPLRVAYERRNRDLDPQLVWRGKDQQDWSDLVVQAPPLFIQEKIHPKVLIDDLRNRSARAESGESGYQTDLFADFNGLADPAAKTEFYLVSGAGWVPVVSGPTLVSWSSCLLLGCSDHGPVALTARGKSQTAPRPALFRQNGVPESLKITNIHAILRIVLTKNCSLSGAEHFHHGLLRTGAGLP